MQLLKTSGQIFITNVGAQAAEILNKTWLDKPKMQYKSYAPPRKEGKPNSKDQLRRVLEQVMRKREPEPQVSLHTAHETSQGLVKRVYTCLQGRTCVYKSDTVLLRMYKSLRGVGFLAICRCAGSSTLPYVGRRNHDFYIPLGNYFLFI